MFRAGKRASDPMANGLVIHIVAGDTKHTQVLTQDRIRIGTRSDCDIQLRPSDFPAATGPADVLLELGRANGSYRIIQFDPTLGLTCNGSPVENNARIKDGDELRIPASDFSLQFFTVRALPAIIPGYRQETHPPSSPGPDLNQATALARRDDAKVFLREFTRELVREINISTKLIALAIAIALVGGILYLGMAMVKEVQQTRRENDMLQSRLQQLNDQVNHTNDQLTDIGKSNKEIRDSLSLAVKLRSEYGRGVCLISGSYVFVETGTGRALRYHEAQVSQEGTTIQNSNESQPLTPDGKGPVAEFEFVGTGFYVGGGYVMTNRHVAQPWLADERTKSLSGSVNGQPRLKKLIAFFPNQPQPISLKFKQAAQREDLAVCTLDVKDVPQGLPVLPLEKDLEAVAVGKAVVMMGYPSGPDRLLALMDESEARGIQARYGSLEALLGYLSEGNHIQPLTTQGHITDMDVRRIVYDARTAEGGSGAPLFGPTGRVIGVNFAVFTENTASNFAVPIRYGLSLLERANWKYPETGDPEQNSSVTNSNQQTAHPPSASVSR